ncbi:helix-turn-helix transcriptional regulator [Neptunicella sp. SCSIO 80796]|uniref:helix-turn-helix transcriptional regulator n=1 Tax=Neptunicella plasticusilytica TaxID=3117012 RepID=UPI003A4DCF90
MSGNADKILYMLKTRGSQKSQTLAKALGMTSMGARQHLLQLEQNKLVSSYSRAEKVGRPSQYWQLTELAMKRFPDRHEQLTLSMIESVKSVFGNPGLEKLIYAREQQSEKEYLRLLSNKTTLAERVHELAEIRSQEGYMAEYEQDKLGHFWLLENHCPICAAASQCQDFCRSELQLFQRCLLGLAEVSREEHILDGSRRCAYRIVPLD